MVTIRRRDGEIKLVKRILINRLDRTKRKSENGIDFYFIDFKMELRFIRAPAPVLLSFVLSLITTLSSERSLSQCH
jgi:hypothetical protein